jgi:chromosomal replication initiator protein
MGVSRSAHNLQRTWQRILEHLPAAVSASDKREFLEPLRLVALTSGELRLQAPTRHLMACVSESHLGALQEATRAVTGRRHVRIEVAPREQGELFPDRSPRALRRRRAAGAALDARFTFETFVVGASNQFAHAAARAVAAMPGEQYNPLFVYGGVGLGKTHLATAIGHAVLERTPEARVVCLSADAFMNELIAAIRRDRVAHFKRRLRDLDVLILDDIHVLAGKERTQEEFFHTFNSLHGERHQIVLTSDTVPRDIPGLEERLQSRLEWGLIADIQPPDVETRAAILLKKAELEDIALGRDVALLLAEHVTSNVRELESALTRLAAETSLRHEAITVEGARRVLGTIAGASAGVVTFDAIARSVCEHFALPPADLRSRRRSRHVAVPRQVAMYLCRRLLDASYPYIGELFGRDHSTVMHGVAVTERRLKDDVAFQTLVAQIERDVRTRHHP